MRPALAAAGCGLALLTAAATAPRAQTGPSELRFEGSWSASGRRQTLPTETGRSAAISYLSGAVVLTKAVGLSGGFRGEAIGFDAGAGPNSGRAVWTDTRGDRVFSTITGDTLQTGRRVAGTITGGTGRYVGVTGEYEMTWQYVISDDGESIHGSSMDLRGRIRVPAVSK